MTAGLGERGRAAAQNRERRAGPAAGNGVKRAIRVVRKALWWRHRGAGSTTPERKAELGSIFSRFKHRALLDVRALIGKSVVRVHPLTGEREVLDVTPQIARVWLALVDALLCNLRVRSQATGEIQSLAELTREKASNMALISARTFTTWMPWLEAAGVLLYHHGRSRHPGVVGFPELYRLQLPHTRGVVEEHLHAAVVGDENRWWWAPMCRALLESERASRNDADVGNARAELARAVVETEAARLEWEHARTVDVNENVCKKKEAELALRRMEIDARRRRDQAVEAAAAAAAELEAFAVLDAQRRAIAIVEAKRRRALQLEELEELARQGLIEHVLARAKAQPNAAIAQTSQSSGSARNNDRSLNDQLDRGSSTPPQAAGARTGDEGSPSARKDTLAPHGATSPPATKDNDLEATLRRWRSLPVDDGPAAVRGSPPTRKFRLVPRGEA